MYRSNLFNYVAQQALESQRLREKTSSEGGFEPGKAAAGSATGLAAGAGIGRYAHRALASPDTLAQGINRRGVYLEPIERLRAMGSVGPEETREAFLKRIQKGQEGGYVSGDDLKGIPRAEQLKGQVKDDVGRIKRAPKNIYQGVKRAVANPKETMRRAGRGAKAAPRRAWGAIRANPYAASLALAGLTGGGIASQYLGRDG